MNEANVAEGGLNAVQTGSVQKAAHNKLPLELLSIGTSTDCQQKTVTLTLTADDVTTNGLVTVAYDASKLTSSDKSARHSTTASAKRAAR